MTTTTPRHRKAAARRLEEKNAAAAEYDDDDDDDEDDMSTPVKAKTMGKSAEPISAPKFDISDAMDALLPQIKGSSCTLCLYSSVSKTELRDYSIPTDLCPKGTMVLTVHERIAHISIERKIALSSDAGVDLAGKLDRIYRALLSEYPSAADEHGRGLDSTIIHYAARLSAEYHPVNLEM